MITPATRWTPLPGALASAWECSNTGLVRRTAAPPGYEGFIGRLVLPSRSGKRIQYTVKPLHKGLMRAVSLREILGLHGIAEVPGLDWLEQARAFVDFYNAQLDAGGEDGDGGQGGVRELRDSVEPEGGPGQGAQEGAEDGGGGAALPALPGEPVSGERKLLPAGAAVAERGGPAGRLAAPPRPNPCGRAPLLFGCSIKKIHAQIYGWPFPCTKCERPGVLHA